MQNGSEGASFRAIDELEELARADRFNSWIFDVIEPHLGDRVLEVGAGIGTMTRRLLRSGRSVTSLEPAENLFPILEERVGAMGGADVLRCTAQQFLLSDREAGFDSVVYVSVLEHIFDDAAELRTAAALVRPGGTVIVFVPAMPQLFGAIDLRSGHYRRYDADGLRTVLGEGGLDIIDVRWMDVLGVVPYLLVYRILRISRLTRGSNLLYDAVLVPLSRRFESVLPVQRFGKNLIAFAVRDERT